MPTTRITRSNRPKDPNGRIQRVRLRIDDEITKEWPVDGPSWRTTTEHIIRTAWDNGWGVPTVRSEGRLLLGYKADWDEEQDSRRALVDGTDVYLRSNSMPSRVLLQVLFGVVPPHYQDEDCFIDFDPVKVRPTLKRGPSRYNDDEPDLVFGATPEDEPPEAA